KGRSERGEVVRVCIHIVAVPRLARSAGTAARMSDAATAPRPKEEPLVVPCVGVERPAVAEHDWLSRARAPVLVIDLSAVFRRDCGHRFSPSYWAVAFVQGRAARANRDRGKRLYRSRLTVLRRKHA